MLAVQPLQPLASTEEERRKGREGRKEDELESLELVSFLVWCKDREVDDRAMRVIVDSL